MEKVTIEIKTGGSAFDGDAGQELARILRKLADRFEEGGSPSSIMDINGNKACTVQYE